jgi:hypothetical protein
LSPWFEKLRLKDAWLVTAETTSPIAIAASFIFCLIMLYFLCFCLLPFHLDFTFSKRIELPTTGSLEWGVVPVLRPAI